MIVPVALAAMLGTCAPSVGPVTMSAVVQYESGWQANAIGDNTAKHSYFPKSRGAAIAIAGRLLRAGHNIDAGLAQVNSGNFRGYDLSVETVFDPCTNLNVGSRILSNSYAQAVKVYGPGETALWHALQRYNSGLLNGHPKYAYDVFATAFSSISAPAYVPSYIPPETPVERGGSSRQIRVSVLRAQVVHVHQLPVAHRVRLQLTGTNAWYFPDQSFALPAVKAPAAHAQEPHAHE